MDRLDPSQHVSRLDLGGLEMRHSSFKPQPRLHTVLAWQVNRVRAVVREAKANVDLSYEYLVDALNSYAKDGSVIPLHQVCVIGIVKACVCVSRGR